MRSVMVRGYVSKLPKKNKYGIWVPHCVVSLNINKLLYIRPSNPCRFLYIIISYYMENIKGVKQQLSSKL
jgi:hypothetical protein